VHHPRTTRGYIQLGFALLFVVLLAVAATGQMGDLAFAISALGAVAILYGSSDREMHRSFSESIRRSRIPLSPAQAYLAICIGTLAVLIFLRLLVWLAG
jgi:hypothetical protein